MSARVVEAARLQLAHEAAELLVAVGDLAVVLGDQPLAVRGLLVVGARVGRGWPAAGCGSYFRSKGGGGV